MPAAALKGHMVVAYSILLGHSGVRRYYHHNILAASV